MTNCKELFEIFEKVGGKIICKYDTKKCTFFPQMIYCLMKPEDDVNLGILLKKFEPLHYDYVTRICIETIHRYQNESSIGFIIEHEKEYDIGFMIEFGLDKDGNIKKTKIGNKIKKF